MIIATLNVNSIRARYLNIIDYLNDFKPDVLLMQEIKCETEKFPYMELEDLGYNIKAKGQKSYNGVAILSKFPIEDIVDFLPTYKDDINARYLECFINGYRIINVYMPNGNPINTSKFTYKLNWMEKFNSHIKMLLKNDEKLILGGDFNVAISDMEVYNPKLYMDNAVTDEKSREKLKELMDMGFINIYRNFYPNKNDAYTWFAYSRGALAKNTGLMLDYFFAQQDIANKIKDAQIDLQVRQKEHSSDHAALWIEI